MSDNVKVTQGTGTTMATNEIATVHYPRTKVVFGESGSAVDASLTNPLPVTQTGTPALPVDAATATNQATGNASLASIDAKLDSPIDVAVTNFPPTQPISGTVAVSNFPATQPVSGTVTANAGTGTMLVDGSAHTQPVSGTVSVSGTVPVSGTVTANIGTTNGLALDATVSGLTYAQGSTTLTQKGSLSQAAVTTAAPTYLSSTTRPLSLNTSGGLRVDGSGVTQPVSGTVTANAGTGTMLVDGSAHTQPVSGTVSVSGTVPVSGTVTANIGTTGGLALDASVTGLQVAQGSTTSGQKGGVALGAVTTAAPTYTTAQSNPLSLNTAGGLRVDGSGVTQPVSAASLPLPSLAATSTKQSDGTQKSQVVDGANATVGPVTAISAVNYLPVIQASSATTGSAVPARSTLVAGSDGTNARNLSTDTSGNLNVNISERINSSGTNGAVTVGTSAVIAASNGTSNLSNRKLLTVLNNSSVTIYWGYNNTVTTSSGTPIYPKQIAAWDIGSTLSVFLIAATASNNVRIGEAL